MREPDLLFVYGTLRRDCRHSMHHLLGADASFEGHATWQGRIYDAGSYPVAVPSDDETDLVLGELYRLANPEAVLPELDRYEGFFPDDPEGSAYRRSIECVQTEDGTVHRAWVYLYTRPVRGLTHISHGDYVTYLRS